MRNQKNGGPRNKRPPADAPNVIIFLLDDVGFAQVESFGGLIETPNIDALADNGLRYNNFHTTALMLTFSCHTDGRPKPP